MWDLYFYASCVLLSLVFALVLWYEWEPVKPYWDCFPSKLLQRLPELLRSAVKLFWLKKQVKPLNYYGIYGMFRVVTQKTYAGTRGRLNKKDGLTRYGNSHVKDKTS